MKVSLLISFTVFCCFNFFINSKSYSNEYNIYGFTKNKSFTEIILERIISENYNFYPIKKAIATKKVIVKSNETQNDLIKIKKENGFYQINLKKTINFDQKNYNVFEAEIANKMSYLLFEIKGINNNSHFSNDIFTIYAGYSNGLEDLRRDGHKKNEYNEVEIELFNSIFKMVAIVGKERDLLKYWLMSPPVYDSGFYENMSKVFKKLNIDKEVILLSTIKNGNSNDLLSKVRKLLDLGTNPNFLDKDYGDTSFLMYSIDLKNYSLMEVLISYGADINFENKVLYRCMLEPFLEGFNLLIDKTEISKKSIQFALLASLLRNERSYFTKKIIEKFPDYSLSAKNKQNKSALDIAIFKGNNTAVKLLQEIYID